jgi:hypothetical protein
MYPRLQVPTIHVFNIGAMLFFLSVSLQRQTSLQTQKASATVATSAAEAQLRFCCQTENFSTQYLFMAK